jgi:prevent-host-death family protein
MMFRGSDSGVQYDDENDRCDGGGGKLVAASCTSTAVGRAGRGPVRPRSMAASTGDSFRGHLRTLARASMLSPDRIRVVACDHMARMGIRELRDTLTQTMRRVRGGESVTVTHDGEPVALIVPYPEDRIAQLAAEGKVRLPLRPLLPLPEPMPVTGPMTASEALEDDRGD